MSNAQINSVGAMDSYLQNTVGYSFWTSEYVPHAPFSFDYQYKSLSNLQLNGSEQVYQIDRQQDLVGRIYFTCTLASLSDVANAYYCEDVGHAMWDSIKLSIGGNTEVQVLYPEAEHAYEQVSIPVEKRLGKIRGASDSVLELQQLAANAQKIWCRLRFWFGEDYGLFLPQISMYLSPVSIKMKTKNCSSSMNLVAVNYGGTVTYATAITSPQLAIESVYLDDPERNHFAQSQLRYLMCETQKFEKIGFLTSASTSGTTTQDITGFNHPMLEYLVLFRKSTNRLGSDASFASYFNFNGSQTGTYVDEGFNTITLKVNGNKRYEDIDAFHARVIMPAHHHSSVPQKRVYVLPFSINPEDFSHPAGSLNHSRLDNVKLEVTPQTGINYSSTNLDLILFGRNVNVVEVNGGVLRKLFSS